MQPELEDGQVEVEAGHESGGPVGTEVAVVVEHRARVDGGDADDVLEDEQAHNKELLKDLTERRDKRQEALGERQGKLLDIESRLKLAALMPQIEKTVEQVAGIEKQLGIGDLAAFTPK